MAEHDCSEAIKRTCTKCGKEFPATSEFFYRRRQSTDGLVKRCKGCLKGIALQPHQQAQRRKNAKSPSRLKARKNYTLERLYGISIEDFNNMFAEQEGCCAVCKKHQSEFSNAFHVDHCHKTGKVRGLLCIACNSQLPIVENGERLQGAIEYLKSQD